MPFRSTAVAALALGAIAGSLGAQDFAYSPGNAQYHASVVTQTTREMGGQRTTDEITQSQRLRVGLTPGGGDTLRLAITLDSATLRSATAGPQDVTPLVGLSVEARISRLGTVYSSTLASRDIGPTGALVANELGRFLPRLRADLRPGLTWTDTTSERLDMLGIPVSRRVITRSTVAGDTAVAGGRHWKIRRQTSVDFTGSGTMTGQQVRLDGSSTSTGTIIVSRAGRFVASDQADSTTTSFVVPATGMEIAMTQRQTTTVELMP